jgi:endonuclease III-like uncharacterized protein
LEKNPLDDLQMNVQFSEPEFHNLIVGSLITQEAMWKTVLDHLAAITADRSGGKLEKQEVLELMREEMRLQRIEILAQLVQNFG